MEVYDFLNLLIPYQNLLSDLERHLDAKQGDKVLDAGCGTCNLTTRLFNHKVNVIGIDGSRQAIDLCKKKNSKLNLTLWNLEENLPFSDNYFDGIVCNNVLYAIPEEKRLQLMNEFIRVLKPGGKVVIGNPIEGWSAWKIYLSGVKDNFSQEGLLKTILKLLRLLKPTIKILYYNKIIKTQKNYYFFNIDEQKELLKNAGFSNLSETKISYAGQSIVNFGYK